MEKIICEYCRQPLAFIDIKNVKLPLTAEQFKSLMPDRGVIDPFHPEAGWENWKCVYCRLRPFIDKDHLSVLQDDGIIDRIDLKESGFSCAKCGKEYKHQSSLSRHEKDCNG